MENVLLIKGRVSHPPDADETSQSLQAKFPVAEVFSYVSVKNGRFWLKPEGVALFAET